LEKAISEMQFAHNEIEYLKLVNDQTSSHINKLVDQNEALMKLNEALKIQLINTEIDNKDL